MLSMSVRDEVIVRQRVERGTEIGPRTRAAHAGMPRTGDDILFGSCFRERKFGTTGGSQEAPMVDLLG
jgi:hypothetical protein